MTTPTKFTGAFLTTGVLSAATCRLLDEWSAGIDLAHRREYSNAPIMIAPTDTGWFVNAAVEERHDAIPDDLWACIEYAKAHGCDLIQFDADGDDADELPDLGGPTL